MSECVLLVISFLRTGGAVFIVFLGNETLEFESFSVVDLLSFGLRAQVAVHERLRALASGTGARPTASTTGAGGGVFGGFRPGMNGVDVQEDVDDWRRLY